MCPDNFSRSCFARHLEDFLDQSFKFMLMVSNCSLVIPKTCYNQFIGPLWNIAHGIAITNKLAMISKIVQYGFENVLTVTGRIHEK